MNMIKLKKEFILKFIAFFLTAILLLYDAGYNKNIAIAEETVLRIPLDGAKRIEKSLLLAHAATVDPLPIRRKRYSYRRERASSLPNPANNLGPIIILNTMDLSTVIVDNRDGTARLKTDSSELSKQADGMLELFRPTGTVLTYYLFGILKTSWASRFVHGLNYERAETIAKENGNQALLEYIRERKAAFGIGENVVINKAKMLNPYRLYLEIETDKQKCSMVMGYPTKNDKVSFMTQDGRQAELDLHEGYGNMFSPDVEPAKEAGQSVINLGDYIDVISMKGLIQRAHKDGNFVIMDLIPWVSPSGVTEENYHLFNHSVIEESAEERSDEDILTWEQSVILHLSDGRRVRVHFRDAQDQLSPDFNNHGDYWHKYIVHYIKQLIERLDIDGFRIDLAYELHTGEGGNIEDYDFLKHILFEIIENALREKGKRVYFVHEVYEQFHRDIVRKWNEELTGQLRQRGLLGGDDEYSPFKMYFPDIFEGIQSRNTDDLVKALKWVLEGGKDTEISYAANFDEFAPATYIHDEKLRKGYMLLLILMSKTGYNTLIYPRDLIREGDLKPVPGGKRDRSTGKFVTHKFLTGEKLSEKVKYRTEAEWLKTSLAYAAFNRPIAIESISIAEHKIIFNTRENIKIEIDLDTGETVWTLTGMGAVETCL
ncbi:MAG: hypothetical protein KKB22_02260 [Candidatus Omnitrophica bacterium]|nr:hypothetical protein [Candidatus Omnitrophota bacterium]